MVGSKNNAAVLFMSINRQILKGLWIFFSHMPQYYRLWVSYFVKLLCVSRIICGSLVSEYGHKLRMERFINHLKYYLAFASLTTDISSNTMFGEIV